MNNNYEMKKNAAASVLTDELVEVFNKLDKAMTISQEVTDEYFNKLDSSDRDGRTEIAIGFNRAGVFASIAEDYVFEAKKLVMELVARSQNNIREDEVV